MIIWFFSGDNKPILSTRARCAKRIATPTQVDKRALGVPNELAANFKF